MIFSFGACFGSMRVAVYKLFFFFRKEEFKLINSYGGGKSNNQNNVFLFFLFLYMCLYSICCEKRGRTLLIARYYKYKTVARNMKEIGFLRYDY